MSELINNSEHRREQLKGIILALHEGNDAAELRRQFKTLLDQVGAEEIMALEQSLIEAGSLTVEDITKLCDVHVAVFRETLEQQAPVQAERSHSHPIELFGAKSRAVKELVDELRRVVEEIAGREEGADIEDALDRWQQGHAKLMEVDEHYSLKENLLFPYLEQHGVSGPSSVMWAIHDEIRAGLKKVSALLLHQGATASGRLATAIREQVLPVYDQVAEMVFKEENILYPTCREVFTEEEWATIAGDLGIAMDATAADAEETPEPALTETVDGEQKIQFETGSFTVRELEALLNTLPFDITFVGADDTLRYFSNGKERIFQRTQAVLGRDVHNCHPPKSIHVVNRIVEDFKSGARDHADFWIQSRGMFIYIRYFAVRSPEGEYLGILEVTQNVQPIRELEGEKRILDDLPVS